MTAKSTRRKPALKKRPRGSARPKLAQLPQTATVTVLLPTYNRVFWLQRAVKSILAQTFRDFHLYIMDDASTDDTAAYASKIKDPRVTYIRQPQNLGVAGNWLNSLQRVESPYFCLLMDDDFYSPEYLQSRIEALEKSPEVGVAFGAYHSVDESGAVTRPARILPESDGKIFTPVQFIHASNGGGVHIGGMVFRTGQVSSLFKKAASYGIVIDAALLMLMAFHKERGGVYVKESNFYMTHQPNQVFHQRRGEVYVEIDRLFTDLLNKPNLSGEQLETLRAATNLSLQEWALFLSEVDRPKAFTTWLRAIWNLPYAKGFTRRRLYILARILGLR